MKDQEMSKTFSSRMLVALLAASAMSMAAAQDKKDRDPREFTYFQLAGGSALTSSAGIDVGLGAGVQLPGDAHYGRGNLWGLTLGYQFLRQEDEKARQQRRQCECRRPQQRFVPLPSPL